MVVVVGDDAACVAANVDGDAGDDDNQVRWVRTI